ncbi:MAG: outer membrane lipoprotein-sorting protein [Spirochaetia bacterium]|nr:outer membrane lipoprotein-sorting protein [Spirochaetia bacterium]NCC89377.1 outer membrane lipoprotein-sorting protein [Spirochaetia bacterium]
MSKPVVKLLLTLLLLCTIPSFLFALTGEDVIRRMDEMATFDTSVSTGSIKTTDRFGTKISTFKAWARGTSDSLIEFTSTAERGQKILRTQSSLYLFYPDAEELIRLQGAALRQSVLGSDLSYEDMTEEKNTLDSYTVVLEGSETVKGHDCHVLTLTAKKRTVAYPVQKIWVDKQTYLVWKAEYSTAQKRLLKVMEVLSTIETEGRTLPSETKIEDKMKRDSATWMTLDSLEVNVPLEANLFTLENLTW